MLAFPRPPVSNVADLLLELGLPLSGREGAFLALATPENLFLQCLFLQVPNTTRPQDGHSFCRLCKTRPSLAL
jgi:hypothetical protein